MEFIMKKIISPICIVSLALLSQACSIAPFASEKSAKTLGKNNYEMAYGASPAGYVAISKGLADNIDASLTIERQWDLIGSLSMKYAMMQSDEGSSIAATGGLFVTSDGSTSGYYLGPIMSYKYKWFELYGHVKYNRVSWKADSTFNEDDYTFEHDLKQDASFGYFLGVVGTNLQFAKHWSLNLNAKTLFVADTSSDGDNLLPSLSLLYRF
jgi:hypothetical protein